MPDQTLCFTLDCTGIEEADDGNTSYYGGSYTLNGKEGRGRGNDRSDSFIDDIRNEILSLCAVRWPEPDFVGDDGFMDMLDESIASLDRNKGVITVTLDEEFSVTAIEL